MLNKHDCFIQTADGKVLLYTVFSFAINYEGFKELYTKILRVGLEASWHFSYNLLGFLLSKELQTFVFNPLHTYHFRKCLSLRKTKTDKVVAYLLLYKSELKLERVLQKSKRTGFFFQSPCGAVHFIKSEDSDLRIFNNEPAEVLSSHR